MLCKNSEICVDSSEKSDFIDVTEKVRNIVINSRIKQGIANIFTKHTTTAIRINENEKGLMQDIKCFLEEKCPPFRDYKHDDIENRPVPPDEQINAHSHMKSLLMGTSETIPIINGKLALGKWQSIFFVDLDGPRKRKMLVHIIGK